MAMRLFLGAASAAVLAWAQAPSDDSACTAKSFAIPSWFVQDVKYAEDVVSFNVWNRATNYTADLACETTETGLNACSIEGTPSSNDTLEASVEIRGDATTFHLKQSWTCSDREKTLTFTAIGNNSAAADYTSPLLLRGSLTEPVSITPIYPDGPTGHDSAGCSFRSEAPSWTLSSIHYTDEPAAGEGTVGFRNFNVLVTNPANGYQASCMPGGSFGDRPDLAHLVCAGYEFQSSSVGQYPIVTQASFDPATSTFTLNQTWFCDDIDAAKPLQITATGASPLPLTCTTTPGTRNQTNTYCSTASSVPLPGTLGATTTLRPYALEDPAPGWAATPPRGDGCTLTSIFDPRWQFSAFRVDGGAVSFEIILVAGDRGFQYPIPVYQGEAVEVEGEEGWYECEIGADGGNGLPLWPYRCSFRYEGEGGGLVVKADWECMDLDREHPVKFNGVTTTAVNTTLECETVDGVSQCMTTDPGYTWVAPISDVIW
ncbi:hypothetical protein B0I37DRAFT_432215 [Chaetomium sp. MPI-CAGE-AT-0009]|nr:hypothetical protein B0I37DRAFT_432215 [Chaetomium sp. MPI-CAGE-AT-0009]